LRLDLRYDAAEAGVGSGFCALRRAADTGPGSAARIAPPIGKPMMARYPALPGHQP
jgi:hypothetical protein